MRERVKEPFEYKNKDEFKEKLMEWIGDVFYDILPEYGYEVREEQIYTAFQFAEAFCSHEVHFAEAGLGTGKTFAYLLTAFAYARFSGKPVVIACATTALQEQLAGYEGDIRTLSKLLDLEIDAPMAKDPHQYICDVKVNDATKEISTLSDEIRHWINQTKHGERSEIPTIPDRVWKWIGWDESRACDVCASRGFCKLVKAREYYRPTKDLIIADHAIFFYDLWTRKERIANGILPVLPSYSGVIFDEGHKILLPAAMQAGHKIDQEEIENLIQSIEEIHDARTSFLSATVAMEHAFHEFFADLSHHLINVEGSNRLSIKITDHLLKAAKTFQKKLDHLLLEFQIEQELYIESLSLTQIQAYEGQIEKSIKALDGFCKKEGAESISWVDQGNGSFWVVPRHMRQRLDKHLFQKGIPVSFTSATLSNEGNFDYFMRTLGVKQASKSIVGSPFDFEKQVAVYLNESSKSRKESFNQRIETLVRLLKQNGGRALVLTNSMEEVRKIRLKLGDYKLPFDVLWEDKGDRGYLVRKFREEETSILIGANFWEGIDVPGDALTLLIVWRLPFPVRDPLIEVQRKEAEEQGLDPYETVDYPEMGIKLKQGCGRLIRTQNDHGAIAILDPVIGTPWEKVVIGALPPKSKVGSWKI
ncbi:ATP-dependent DNA helicase [Clostridium sp. E02]|uniref:ATP-dependent DNA helicase n=1 Tax=Clostridium sp. E02 TaxID=2487134 RepID=UPI000F53F4C6|nr:ATP-dependent DNA helicase [Clostridium sp. E02]